MATSFSDPRRLNRNGKLSETFYSRVNNSGRRSWRCTGQTTERLAEAVVMKWRAREARGKPGHVALSIDLPYPPTVNTYWRHVGSKVLISKTGRRFRDLVEGQVMLLGLNQVILGKIEVSILVAPPDRRRRDIDNVLKALLDALEHAGVYRDDSQIAKLSIERSEPVENGRAFVEIIHG